MSFLGNVTVGADISLPSLRQHYNGVYSPSVSLPHSSNHTLMRHGHSYICHASQGLLNSDSLAFTRHPMQVVLAYGAESDRKLNIPGEVRNNFVISWALVGGKSCWVLLICAERVHGCASTMSLCKHKMLSVLLCSW